MGRSRLLAMLLVASLLLQLSSSHGFGRKVMETGKLGDSPVEHEENGGKWRKMVEELDYEDPKPNTNPKNGYFMSPPPPAGHA